MAKKEDEDTKALLQEKAEFEARRRGEMAKKEADDAKKAQREEEIRQQKEIAEKQAQIRKAQMLAETAFQLVPVFLRFPFAVLFPPPFVLLKIGTSGKKHQHRICLNF